jgi:hypothetical protein
MIRKFFAGAAFLLLLALPQVAAARILPDCDITIYQVGAGGFLRPDPSFVGPRPDYLHLITPELYSLSPGSYQAAGTPIQDYDIKGTSTGRACGFNDFVQLFVNLVNWGFTILAITATLFMVWGGFTLLVAGGRREYVENGKRILEGTVIGTVIVLTAWVVVNFWITGIVGSNTFQFAGKDLPNYLNGGDASCQKEFRENLTALPANCGAGDMRFGCLDQEGVDGPVTQLQRRLNSICSGLCGPANGCYGNNTAHCVRMFQAANGITADGIVGQQTYTAIDPVGNQQNCFSVPYESVNPLGFPEYENVFPTNGLSQLGSCRSNSGFSCLPAHGPFDCPKNQGGLTPDYTYFPNPC